MYVIHISAYAPRTHIRARAHAHAVYLVYMILVV